MNLFGFLAFLIGSVAVFIVGFVLGVWVGTKKALKSLEECGYTIVPPKEE